MTNNDASWAVLLSELEGAVAHKGAASVHVLQPEQIFACQCLSHVLSRPVIGSLVTLDFPVVPEITSPFVPETRDFLSSADRGFHLGMGMKVLTGGVVFEANLVPAFNRLARLALSAHSLRVVHDEKTVRVSFVIDACHDLLTTSAAVVG